jgi:DNA-binding NarL/FixJ family response regulator
MKPEGPKVKAKLRIFLVDDHLIFRQGIKMVLEMEDDLVVCGEADSAQAALAIMDASRPDLALVDLQLRNSNGLELIKDLRIRYPRLPVLVLSMHDEGFYAERALRAGARGYINKEGGRDDLVRGIRQVLAGQRFVSESVAATLISKSLDGRTRRDNPTPQDLSDRELQIFELIGNGCSSSEIAAKLHLSIKTIDSHREHIKRKLGLTNGTQLVKQAFHWVHHAQWSQAREDGSEEGSEDSSGSDQGYAL